MLPGLAPKVVGSSKLRLTQKGYGHVYTQNNAAVTLSYGNVDGGVAPASGDLVVWIALTRTISQIAFNDLTLGGWAQKDAISAPFSACIVAKKIGLSDIASPPSIYTGSSGSYGTQCLWVAYRVAGSIKTISVPVMNMQWSNASAPSNQSCNSSAIDPPSVSITMAGAQGSDNSPSLTLIGAPTDVSLNTPSNSIAGLIESAFKATLVVGGGNITVSKSDDGGENALASGYVTVIG